MNGIFVDVVEQVGIMYVGVFYYFGLKQKLLFEVLVYCDQDDVVGFVQKYIFGGLELFLYFVCIVFMNEKCFGIVQVYMVLLVEFVIDDYLFWLFFEECYMILCCEVMVVFYELCVQEGVFDLDMIVLVVVVILVVMDGFQLQWLLYFDVIGFGDVSVFVIEVIVNVVLYLGFVLNFYFCI